MILWVKRITALWSGIFLVALLYEYPWIALIGGILNLVWVVDEKWPPALRGLIRPSILVANTILSAYFVLKGAPPLLAVLVTSTSLQSWNARLFLRRWNDAPVAVQSRYLKHLGAVVGLGLGAGLSSLVLQGLFRLSFFPVFLLVLITGVLWIRVMSKAHGASRTKPVVPSGRPQGANIPHQRTNPPTGRTRGPLGSGLKGSPWKGFYFGNGNT